MDAQKGSRYLDLIFTTMPVSSGAIVSMVFGKKSASLKRGTPSSNRIYGQHCHQGLIPSKVSKVGGMGLALGMSQDCLIPPLCGKTEHHRPTLYSLRHLKRV